MGIWNRFNIYLTQRRIAHVASAMTKRDVRDIGFRYLRLKLDQLNDDLDRRQHVELVAFCRLHGCDMQHAGGANAGCPAGDLCSCSIPVMKCARCGDCDFGDNEEADEIRRCCAEGVPPPMGKPWIMRHSERVH